jgi:DNA-binding XRE family transcriptional regulator/tetratricopeptide (TPR) repeat protein
MFVKRRSFAQARRAAGFTQESLAERLGVDRTTVARWESGEYSPQPWLRPKIAEALGLSLGGLRELVDGTDEAGTTGHRAGTSTALIKADDVPLGGCDHVAAAHEHAGLSQAMELAGAYAETKAPQTTTGLPQLPWNTDRLAVLTAYAIVAAFATVADGDQAAGLTGSGSLASLASVSSATHLIATEWEDHLYEQLKHVLGDWVHTVNRRELLRLLRWAATTLAAAHVSGLNPDEQQRLTKAIAVPSRVDGPVIDHIEMMLQHCKRQEDALGPHAVLQTVLAQRQLVDGLLTECPDGLRPRLLSVYSSMSTSVGAYCFNLDDTESAQYYCDQARVAAQEARNTELAIHALCTMSFFASWQGKAHASMDCAAAAQTFGAKTGDHLLRARAAAEFGFAYAIDGQYKECMDEFDQALASLTMPGSQRSSDSESPLYWFDEGTVASCQSDCLIRLGKPAEATACAERALQLSGSSVSGVAYSTLRLGTARLLSGEIEEAARVIGEGAMLAARIRSARLTNEVGAARGRLEPWKDTRVVRELDERVASCGLVLSGSS